MQQSPLALSVAVISAIAAAAVLQVQQGAWLAAAWVVAMAAASAGRWTGIRHFLRKPATRRSLGYGILLSTGGAFVTGALWGIGAVAFFPATEEHQLFLALFIGAMCAGAVAVNAAHLPTVIAFVLPSSLPLAACFFIEGPASRMAATVIVIFTAVLLAVSRAGHRAFGDRTRLRLALDDERRKLVESNERLIQEIEQRRTAEATLRQAQKMEAIGHLTGGLAHDFNNLLQVMIGNTNLIQRFCGGNKRVFDYALAAERAALRGAELTSSLLTFARRQTLRSEDVNVNALLREFEPILLRTLGGLVRARIDHSSSLPCCHADAAHFQSAILNLVINARDAMPDGGLLSVKTSLATLDACDLAGNPDASPGRFVVVSIRDTGTGMTDDVIAHAFEPFFTTKDVGKGSGLGLSQVYGFARQSGGHIVLLSEPDQGTEAKLYLPVSEADAESPAAIPVGAQAGPHRDRVAVSP